MRIKTLSMALVMLALVLAAPAGQAAPSLDAQLRALSGQVGIWFFYLSTCPYCAQEEPVLHRISARYEIPITAISLDGGPTPNRTFKHYVYDRGQAAQLGVTVTPTLFLVHPASRQAVRLSQGYQNADALMRRIAHAVHAAGWQNKTDVAPAAPARQRPDADDAAAPTLADQILDKLNADRRDW